jgi:DNA-binding NarL/FixJ family response regulator
MRPIRVGIVDENEIFRRGLLACLAVDNAVDVAYQAAEPDDAIQVDLAIVSPAAGARWSLGVPVLVCSDTAAVERVGSCNDVSGVLPRAELTPEQLIAGVRAAASGLRVNSFGASVEGLSERNLEVLRLLAEGAATNQISEQLGYSERTIKNAIADIVRELGARSRAEAVALGIRRGLI